MTLPRRPLGTTDMEITRVGFGAWAIGGPGWTWGWGSQDDDESVAALRHALDSGVNWVDTAAAYGLGHSEQVIARALKGVPEGDRPLVFTKCGLVWDGDATPGDVRNDCHPDSIRREVEDSLRRLDVEQIDLYQVHWPADDGTPVEEYWQAMLDLKAQGKVRAVGLSNHDVQPLAAAEALGHVDTLQPPFSLLDRRAAAELLPWCVEHGTGVINYSPMQSGLLSGAMTTERAGALPPDDWRSRDDDFTGDKLRANLRLAEQLRTIGDAHGVTVGSVAIAWTLSIPGVTAAIVGARNPGQVDGWLTAATLELNGEELAYIGEAVTATGAGRGPVPSTPATQRQGPVSPQTT